MQVFSDGMAVLAAMAPNAPAVLSVQRRWSPAESAQQYMEGIGGCGLCGALAGEVSVSDGRSLIAVALR